MKKGRKNKPIEEDKTTWLSANGQTIAVEKKHIVNFGMDMNNFFKTKTCESDQCPEDRSSLETIASDMMNVYEVQPTTPNLGKEKSPMKRINKFNLLMNPKLVNPIGKRVLEIAKNSPRQRKEYYKGRVEKHNCGKKSNKSCLKTTKKSFTKKLAAKREYDDVTLCESENVTPRNDITSDPENNEMDCMADGLSSENESANSLSDEAYFQEKEKITLDDFILDYEYRYNFSLNLGSEGSISSEEETIPENNEMDCMANGLSSENDSANSLSEEAYFQEKEITLDDFILDYDYRYNFSLNLGNEGSISSEEETIPSVGETKPKDFVLENEEEEIKEIPNCTSPGKGLERPNETPIKENSKPPSDIKLKAKVNTNRQPLGRPGNVAVVNPTVAQRKPRVMRPGQRLVTPVSSDNGDGDVYPTLQWVIDPPTGDPATSCEVHLHDFIYPTPSYFRRLTTDLLDASMEDELSRKKKKHNKRISRFCRQRVLEKLNIPRERKPFPSTLTTYLINICFSILFTALLFYVYYKTYIGRPHIHSSYPKLWFPMSFYLQDTDHFRMSLF